MHLFDQRTLGVLILLLLALLVVVKRASTGSVVDLPHGDIRALLADGFNFFFLLIVIPLAAILLIAGQMEAFDPTHISIEGQWLPAVEILGAVLYTLGFLVMSWALLTMGRTYQVGGSAPRAQDRIIMTGPYRLIRHPMYGAALSISLGLAALVQSLAIFVVFLVYLALILVMIPLEEQALLRAYQERFAAYKRHTKSLVPLVY